MAEKFQFEGRKMKWGDLIIAVLLGTFGIYFVVTGFVFQTSSDPNQSHLFDPLISYGIGLSLLVAAKMFKHKATGSS